MNTEADVLRRPEGFRRVAESLRQGADRFVTGIAVMAAMATMLMIGQVSAQNGRWVAHGPEGGYVTAIVVDPIIPGSVYAATCGGGVYRSTDVGHTWQPSSNGLGEACVLSLAWDPLDPRVLYAGTSHSSVYRSADRGKTWHPTGDVPNGSRFSQEVTSLAVSAVRAGTVYASIDDIGLFVSSDDGAHWQKVVLELDDPDHIVRPGYVALGTLYGEILFAGDCGVVRSLDGGRTWEEPKVGFGKCLSSLAVDRARTDRIYAGAGSVWTSTDAGTTWSKTAGQPEEAGRVLSLAIAPGNPDEVYAGTYNGVWRSTDGGQTWSMIGGSPPVAGGDTTALAVFAAEENVVLAGTAGDGIHRHTGDGWTASSSGLDALETSLIAVGPQPSPRVWVTRSSGRGSSPVSILRTDDGGQVWSSADEGLDARSLTSIAVDPSDPTHLLLATELGIYMTTNGGDTWFNVHEGSQDVEQVVFAPSDSEIAYAAARNRLLRSSDSGWTWSETGMGEAWVVRIAVAKDDPYVVWIAHGPEREIVRSDDGGETWSLTGLDFRWIGCIPPGEPVSLVVDPADSHIAYLALSSAQLWRYRPTADGQAPWQLLDPPFGHIRDMVAHPTRDGGLIVGSRDEGIWVSRDHGDTWGRLDNGLAFHPHVSRLGISPSRFDLWAATTGGTLHFELSRIRRGGSRYSPSGVPQLSALESQEVRDLRGQPNELVDLMPKVAR